MADGQYLCVKGKAGLGNRMLSALTGILYADMSGRVPVIDWSDFTYSNDGSNVFPRLFACLRTEVALPDMGETSVAPPIWVGSLDKSANEMVEAHDGGDHSGATLWRRYSIDLSRLDHPERVAMFWSYTQHFALLRQHMTGACAHLAKLDDDALIGTLLRERMTLAPDIQARVDDFARTHFDGHVIGVHVRYMDRKTSLGDFLKHVDRQVRGRPDATIFLATDNRQAEETIRARYPRVVTTPKWFPEGGVSMHQNAECPDRLVNAVEALVDMYLLARCDALVFPGSSTFSKIASLVSTMPRDAVVDIERYNPRIRLKRFVKGLLQ